MYITASSPHQPGDDAKLYSPPLKFFGIMCLEFYYYMSGAANGSLLTINSKTADRETRSAVLYFAPLMKISAVAYHPC